MHLHLFTAGEDVGKGPSSHAAAVAIADPGLDRRAAGKVFQQDQAGHVL